MANAFVKQIQNGNLFECFCQAGFRFNGDAELEKELNKKYKQYLKDPSNEELLKGLEEFEDQVAESIEHKAAGGDVEMLKALDNYNKYDTGFMCWDLCQAGVIVA